MMENELITGMNAVIFCVVAPMLLMILAAAIVFLEKGIKDGSD